MEWSQMISRRSLSALAACFLVVVPVNDPATVYAVAAQFSCASADCSANTLHDEDDESEVAKVSGSAVAPKRLERRRCVAANETPPSSHVPCAGPQSETTSSLPGP